MESHILIIVFLSFSLSFIFALGGDLSHELALFLRDMGFPNAKVLVNGWTVWQEMNLPVEEDSFGN